MNLAEKRVLIVEDNPAMASLVRFNLKKAGYDVTVAANGKEAWSRLEERDFDVVVTDHQMPEMTGLELCQRMRRTERTSGTPVIMLTAKELELDPDYLADDLGVMRVLGKPFSPGQLVDAVSELAPVSACAI
jgi:CheY-like chemotaxis protein